MQSLARLCDCATCASEGQERGAAQSAGLLGTVCHRNPSFLWVMGFCSPSDKKFPGVLSSLYTYLQNSQNKTHLTTKISCHSSVFAEAASPPFLNLSPEVMVLCSIEFINEIYELCAMTSVPSCVMLVMAL